jgi:hypothetical protein
MHQRLKLKPLLAKMSEGIVLIYVHHYLYSKHELRVPAGFELILVMHEYGRYVSQSTLITHWYNFRLLALTIAFTRGVDASNQRQKICY